MATMDARGQEGRVCVCVFVGRRELTVIDCREL